ncbi:MAG: S41 family peptidase [Lachnospiraceae bacterium]|nr:S41 family peptidase [Lachnospiraceae bacterium]
MDDRKESGLSGKGGVLLGAVGGFLCALILAGILFVIVWFAAGGSLKPSPVPVPTPSGEGDSGRVVSDALEQKLEMVRGYIENGFLFDYEDADFDSAIVKGYVNELGDPYTVYYTKEELDAMNESMSGTFYGIGVMITLTQDLSQVLVLQAYEECPAYQAGIRDGDIITAVNGESIAGKDLDYVVTLVRGELGTTVDITVLRAGTEHTFKVTRAEVQAHSLEYEMLDNGVGYIQMISFTEVLPGQLKSAISDLQKQGLKALIFDLRSNGGGLLSAVVDICDYLLPAGIITYTEDVHGKRTEYRSGASAKLDVPAVVLTDGYTASASEIFTAALQDYGAAKVFGGKTFGKGIVQVMYTFPDGTGLKYTESRYYTPKGICIHGDGIMPDHVQEDDPETENDELIEAASAFLLQGQ